MLSFRSDLLKFVYSFLLISLCLKGLKDNTNEGDEIMSILIKRKGFDRKWLKQARGRIMSTVFAVPSGARA